MLTVIAEIRTRPGQHHRQAVLDEFAKIIPTVLKEERLPRLRADGGRRHQRKLPGDRARLIIMVEQWETVAHLEAHLQTAHMKAWSDAVKGTFWKPIRILEQGV
ncbi:MAG: antibiotic biosynthesis monooxygenase family protein [Enterobacter hormaechei]